MILEKKNLKLAILAILGLFIYFFISEKYHFAIPCLFYTITGYYCPGCGITRLAFSCLKLDFYQAFRYNPLAFILIILLIIFKLLKIIIKKLIKIDLEIPNYIYYILLIIILLYGILRNVPLFDFLAPTEV